MGSRIPVAGLSGVSMRDYKYACVTSRTFGVNLFKAATANAARAVCIAAGKLADTV